MASSINASTSGAGGVITTADNTGILNLQTASTTAVTVDASQNVGIGTTTPTNCKLDVRTNTTGDTNINIQNDYSGAAYAANLNLLAANTSGSYYNAIVAKNSAGTATWKIDGAGAADTFRISTGSSNTERMRIDSSGNLLVGTTTLYGKVTSEAAGANPTEAPFSANVTSASGVGSCNVLRSLRGGTQVGSITNTSTATAYNTSSDYRLKENIVPMIGALDKVAQLKPVTYKWKIDGSDGQGFIAHELAEIVPDAVTGEKDAVDAESNPKYQGIDTSFLVATLTAAIQEQQTIINDLKARVTALEAK